MSLITLILIISILFLANIKYIKNTYLGDSIYVDGALIVLFAGATTGIFNVKQKAKADRKIFEQFVNRWLAHYPITNLITTPSLQKAPPSSFGENDLYDYGVEAIVVVDQDIYVDLFVKNKGQKEVGIFLSGGLDSSIIAAQIAQRHPRPVHTFSIHFGKNYPNELEYAKSVADRYKTIHHEVEICPKDFLPNIRKTIWHLDDPITIPNFELAKYVAQHVPIIFNGEGSDPCFGGPKNIPMLLGHWYGGIQREKHFREKAYLASYRRSYKHLRELLSPALLEQLDEEEFLESVLVPFFEEPRLNFLDKLMSINIRLKGAHLIFPKVERILGAAGLPAVAPFFTQTLVQSSMEMPSKYKLNKGIEKYILKDFFAKDLSYSIIGRPKSGMRVPVHYWFQGEMKGYKKQLLNAKSIQQAGIFNPKTVQLLLKYSNDKGLKRHGLLTWMIMTFEIWRQIFIEKQTI